MTETNGTQSRITPVHGQTAELVFHFGYCSDEFIAKLACRWFGITSSELEKTVGRYVKGKFAGAIRGKLTWYKCIKEGFLPKSEINSIPRIVKANTTLGYKLVDAWTDTPYEICLENYILGKVSITESIEHNSNYFMLVYVPVNLRSREKFSMISSKFLVFKDDGDSELPCLTYGEDSYYRFSFKLTDTNRDSLIYTETYNRAIEFADYVADLIKAEPCGKKIKGNFEFPVGIDASDIECGITCKKCHKKLKDTLDVGKAILNSEGEITHWTTHCTNCGQEITVFND